MDALSHALLSFILGKALQLDINLQLLLLVSSISLDIDAISIRNPEAAFRTHRGPVHSLLAALIATAIISLGYTVFTSLPTSSLLSVFPICFTGAFSHLILDLFTTGNMTALWPISKRNLALNLTHYIDPTTLGALVTAALTAALAKTDASTSRIVAVAAVAFLTANYAARCYMKNTATKIIRALDASVISEVVSLPTLRPDRWWTIRKTPFRNGYRYEAYQIDSVHKGVLSKDTIESPYINYFGPVELPIDSPQKAVARAKRDKRISSSIEKFLLPAVKVTPFDQETWKTFWYDASTKPSKQESRGIQATVKTDGTITIDSHWTH